MLHKLRSYLLRTLATFLGGIGLAVPVLAQAQWDPDSVGSSTNLPNVGFKQILTNIAKWVSFALGALGLIFLIVGGIMYVTAGGNEDRIGTATRLITYAVIGIVVGLLSYSISTIIYNAVSDGTVY